jgi:hypothetical protein
MKKLMLSLSMLCLMILSSCGSTQLASSWREPNKQVTINQLSKVLVVALFNTETSRRKAEDQMVTYLNGKGVVSYDYLNDKFNKKNETAIREKIREDGFDGAITMRLVDVEQERVYVQNTPRSSPYYYDFSFYYFRNYANSGYYTTTKTYTAEVKVFSIKENKIIWTGVTKTTDPEGVDKLLSEVTKVVYKKMVNEGFVSK